MSITLNTAVPNNADWKTQFQFNDGKTGDLIDFTGATIEIEVRDQDGGIRIEATTGNGKIAIISPGIFELTVPVLEMKNLCAGTYNMGGVYLLNGETISLFTGSISARDGIARI
ncbi:hypothetical protein [Bradyrhizobium sp.]|uniref:hypothetical protein n=1 Tax=Bradyrhizobium sp. TaxID=376 RepID=UPI0025C41C69|nr:hypothetical protein [Bradyrhizobium sp.]